MNLPDQLRDTAHDLHAATDAAAVCLAVETDHRGGLHSFYAFESASPVELEFMALTFLRGFAALLSEQALSTCGDCAQRLARITAAAAALQPGFPKSVSGSAPAAAAGGHC